MAGETPVIGLPVFRQPPGRSDPPLTPVPPAPGEGPEPPTAPLSLPQDGADPNERPPLIPGPEGPTRRSWVGKSHGAGDPRVAARTLAGLLALLLGTVTVVCRRNGRWFRQPTRGQMDDFTEPLGRILVRYLPLEFIGPTLADVTQAAAAGHQYVLDGPLTERIAEAEPNDMGDM